MESERTTNILLNLQLGFEKVLDSWKKLYRCGLVKKLERKLTFSEKEKLERQKDTQQFKQYQARILRIMDSEMKEKLRGDHSLSTLQDKMAGITSPTSSYLSKIK